MRMKAKMRKWPEQCRLDQSGEQHMTGKVLEWTATSASGFLRNYEEVTHPRPRSTAGRSEWA